MIKVSGAPSDVQVSKKTKEMKKELSRKKKKRKKGKEVKKRKVCRSTLRLINVYTAPESSPISVTFAR